VVSGCNNTNSLTQKLVGPVLREPFNGDVGNEPGAGATNGDVGDDTDDEDDDDRASSGHNKVRSISSPYPSIASLISRSQQEVTIDVIELPSRVTSGLAVASATINIQSAVRKQHCVHGVASASAWNTKKRCFSSRSVNQCDTRLRCQ
jgi:hypothetical protein